MKNVRSVPGIPDWFTLLLHYFYRRRCRRAGHTGAGGHPPKYICTRCGQLLDGFTNEQADAMERQLMRYLDDNDR